LIELIPWDSKPCTANIIYKMVHTRTDKYINDVGRAEYRT